MPLHLHTLGPSSLLQTLPDRQNEQGTCVVGSQEMQSSFIKPCCHAQGLSQIFVDVLVAVHDRTVVANIRQEFQPSLLSYNSYCGANPCRKVGTI